MLIKYKDSAQKCALVEKVWASALKADKVC